MLLIHTLVVLIPKEAEVVATLIEAPMPEEGHSEAPTTMPQEASTQGAVAYTSFYNFHVHLIISFVDYLLYGF